ncbi:hypothetical protein NKR19_g2718 [Coniochaeta hoffmannii]|uniref:Uncharacterized protein n=1 Tax=Coniochaeta hoffmannii TaxID=91930 RepID=A0AA38SG25_9PEZI|nr:hypothetical protein NKR19_g2718 [Coniochaeta hoffmannii]
MAVSLLGDDYCGSERAPRQPETLDGKGRPDTGTVQPFDDHLPRAFAPRGELIDRNLRLPSCKQEEDDQTNKHQMDRILSPNPFIALPVQNAIHNVANQLTADPAETLADVNTAAARLEDMKANIEELNKLYDAKIAL